MSSGTIALAYNPAFDFNYETYRNAVSRGLTQSTDRSLTCDWCKSVLSNLFQVGYKFPLVHENITLFSLVDVEATKERERERERKRNCFSLLRPPFFLSLRYPFIIHEIR